jgi:hypothetical protein
METFTYTCVTLRDFCDYADWDYDYVLDELLESDVSWGTNDDTLVTPETVAHICEYAVPEGIDKNLMISLGG